MKITKIFKKKAPAITILLGNGFYKFLCWVLMELFRNKVFFMVFGRNCSSQYLKSLKKHKEPIPLLSKIIDSSKIRDFRVCSEISNFRHLSMLGNASIYRHIEEEMVEVHA